MKEGDILLAKERAMGWLFDYLLIELSYIENRYLLSGRLSIENCN